MKGVERKESERPLTIGDLNFDPPQLPASRLQEIAAEYYGVRGSLQMLEGERDQNCRITSSDGQRYVLKISSAGEDPAVIDFQVQALLHIEHTDPGIPVPRMVRGTDGGLAYPLVIDGRRHQLRLLTYLPGMLYHHGAAPTPGGLYHVGKFLARLNLALAGFSHPAAGHFMPWDVTNGLLFRPQLRALLPPPLQTDLAPVLKRLKNEVYPRLPKLRSQVIHHDGHGANLLRSSSDSDEVVGIIDFGDMIYGPLICDLAVSLADFMSAACDAEALAAAMCRGFHALVPLQARETDLLLDLVIARLVLTLQLFEFRRRHMRQPPPFVSSEQADIIASLKMLIGLDRRAFAHCMRENLR
ncbi:MAG: phosphotransferase [Lysobacterales bacterium]|jgi:Ser/Thr protein kinase RdoA (MazF antagonist)